MSKYNKEDKYLINQLNKETKKTLFYKKITKTEYYNPENKYEDYKTVLFKIARNYLTYNYYPLEIFEEEFAHKISLIIYSEIDNNGFKPLWLSENLLKAFLKSDIPTHLLDFKQVIPTGILFLPPIIKNYDGQYVKWLVFNHRLAYQPISDIKLESKTFNIPPCETDRLSWSIVLDNDTQYATNRDLEINNNELNLDHEIEFYINPNMRTASEEIEKEFTNTITKVLIQTLLFLQLKDENEKFIKNTNKSKGFGRINSKLKPYIIGETYKYKYDGENNNEINKDSISKIIHWRRGFWRNQPIGKRGNPEYKTIWIEPVLVNKDKV